VRFNLNKKEFQKLMTIGKQDYKFLVKQGSQANIVKLDMSEVAHYIPVLAMAQDDFIHLDSAKEQVGNDPDKWVPLFQELRRAGRLSIPQPVKVA
jgi:type IV secretion system protein VirB4